MVVVIIMALSAAVCEQSGSGYHVSELFYCECFFL